MLVGIIYSTEKKVIGKLVEGIRRGLEEQGHQVKLYPDDTSTFTGLAGCKTLIVGSYVTAAFKPKTPSRLYDALSKLGGISGKRSIAFVARGGMGERKSIVQLMKDMEKQGCYIVDQRSFATQEEAYRFAKTLKLKV
jgi:flavorubredoxin